MIFLETIGQEFKEIVNQRALQVLLISIISMLLTQIFKFAYYSIKQKRFIWRFLISTGGFPSSHSAFCVTLCISLGMMQYHENNAFDWTFAVAVVFSCITIHDAMGVRYEASKHATILNNLVSDKSVEERKELGFGKKGILKELLGHKGFEVFGGIAVGIIIGVIGTLICIFIS